MLPKRNLFVSGNVTGFSVKSTTYPKYDCQLEKAAKVWMHALEGARAGKLVNELTHSTKVYNAVELARSLDASRRPVVG